MSFDFNPDTEMQDIKNKHRGDTTGVYTKIIQYLRTQGVFN